MEYNIDIQIRKVDLPKLELDEKTLYWDGKLLSDSPKRFRISEKIELVETTFMLESEEDIDLLVQGDFHKLDFYANREKEMLMNNILIKLFEKVCSLDYFRIIIKDVDENVEENIEFFRNSDMTISDLIVYTLDWENQKNVRIYRNGVDLDHATCDMDFGRLLDKSVAY